MGHQVLLVKQNKKYVTWIVLGVIFILAPVYYLIINSQFREENLTKGLLRVVERNYPFLQVDLTNPKFKINSKLKYDIDKIVFSPRPEYKDIFPFKSLTFQNVKIRVPILFFLGGRKVDVLIDNVFVEDFSWDRKKVINDFFKVPTLQLSFPLLVRNNKYNANIGKVFFSNGPLKTSEDFYSIVSLGNVVLRDINFKRAMAFETNVNGSFKQWGEELWEMHLTGEFKLLEFLQSVKSRFKFIAAFSKFPLNYVNKTIWEISPEENKRLANDDGHAFFIRQKSVEDSVGFSGSLILDNNFFLRSLDISNSSLKKNFLQNYFIGLLDKFYSELSADVTLKANVKLDFPENAKPPNLNFTVMNANDEELVYQLKSRVKEKSSVLNGESEASNLYIHDMKFKTINYLKEESLVLNSISFADGQILTNGQKYNFKLKLSDDFIKNTSYPIIALFDEYIKSIEIIKNFNQKNSHQDISFFLELSDFEYNGKKYNFLLRSLSSLEGTASSELKLIDNQSLKTILSGNYILKNQRILTGNSKADGKNSDQNEFVNSLVISLNPKEMSGEVISGLLFGNNIFFTAPLSGQLVLEKRDQLWTAIMVKLKISKGPLQIGNLWDQVRTISPPERLSELQETLNFSGSEIVGEWTPKNHNFQMILTPGRNKNAKKLYFNFNKNVGDIDNTLNVYIVRPMKGRSTPFFQLKLNDEQLKNNKWNFQTL